MADHVIVKHADTKEILGTYRIICSEFSSQFYSQEQYEMDKILGLQDIKIELGRACIHREWRNGVTLNLIWKGLAQYAQAVNARYMFGCASVKTVSPDLAYSLFWHLSPLHLNETLKSEVLPSYKCPIPANIDSLPAWREIEDQIPPLLRTYLQAGATIASEPALDTFFGCVDLLTVLDLHNMNPKFKRRYFEKSLS
jgi:putative hemolysin